MELRSHDLEDGAPMNPQHCFARQDPETHMALSDNRSPHLAWSGAPEGTRAFAVLCVDPDVPADATDVNQEGKTLPADSERVDFFHWVMVDVLPEITELATGACCDGVTPGGKRNPPGPPGARQGLNNYTQFLAGDADLAGEYFGYDGPCPPWNDERLHHYVFTVYALDTDRLELEDPFDGPGALKAMEGHVLAKASITGTYTLNPEVSG